MSIAFELTSQRQGRAILAAVRERFATASGARSRERRTHYDSFDWRLWQAGRSLTTEREGDGWRLDLRRQGTEGGRSESLGAVPAFVADLPPGPLRDELAPLLEMRRLMPLMELERTRQGLRLLDRREKTVARLWLEGARVSCPGRSTARLPSRLLARPVRGFDRDFEKLLGFLDGQGLARDERPLLHRAYAACALEPGDYEPKVQVPLDPRMPAHRAMRRIHRQLLDVIRRNEAGVRADLDSEFLHDYRVAVRRTRAALGQVKGVFPPERAGWFRDKLAWLGGLTGTLRDLDVYLLKLDDYRAGLPADVAAELDPLEKLLERRQRSEHRQVAKQLDSDRYRRLQSEWAGFLADEEPPDTPPAGLVPIAEVARDRILKAHAKVIKRGRAIDRDSADEKLHRLRIDCKKLRYLLEFFRDLYDPQAIAGVLKALKALQDNLGDFNDLSVQQGAMRGFAEELAAAGAPAGTLMALGRLIAALARRQGEERRRFHDRFGRFDRPRVSKRLRRMVEDAVA